MPIDPKSFTPDSLVEYVEKALEAMRETLEEKDWGIVGSIRKMAEYHDETKHAVRALMLDGNADPKDRIRAMELHNKAVYTIPQIISGLDKLGGSIAARKALGVKDEPKPKTGLAELRSIRGGNQTSRKAAR
jgi:hypothetical protein